MAHTPTIVDELETAQLRVRELELADAVQDEQIAALTKELGAMVLRVSEQDAAITLANDALVTSNAECVKLGESLKTEQAAHVATKGELETARKALANPAFAAAAVKGLASATAEGGSEATEPPMTMEQARSEYMKLDDPVARARFRVKHAKELGIS